MRFLSMFALFASASVLSGCAGNALEALNTPCIVSPANINCGVTGTTGTGTTGTGTTGTGTTGTGTTGTGTTGTTNTGNTSGLSTGDSTLVLEKSVLQVDPTTKIYKPGVSKLTEVQGQTAILEINTNTADNNAWPIAKTMAIYPAGTGAGQGLGNVALGGVYDEYRSYTANSVDEELQVWHFNNSYATQYRDLSAGGTDAIHQAWSFGGTHTTAAAMPTSGSVNYAGKFGATAVTKGFTDTTDTKQTISFNNQWRVDGDTAATANFGTGAFSAVLTPKSWIAVQTMNLLTNGVNAVPADALNSQGGANAAAFMVAPINLKGTISGNSISNGTANWDTSSGIVTNSTTNPMYGGFFGATANEVTGSFALDGMLPAPTGGVAPINPDTRAYLQMSGIYDAQ